jgi:hypothetical protein
MALASSCILPSLVFASVNPGEVQASSRTQLAANALAICINKVYDEGVNTDSHSIKDGHDIFGSVANHQVKTGYWLENLVQGKTQDAHIYCSNKDSNILDIAAKQLGTNWQSLVCNGTKPGLMKLQYYDGSVWKDSSQDCSGHLGNTGNDYRYVWNDRAKAIQHLNSIHNRDWSTSAGFKDSEFYYLYLDEFMAVCTNGESVPAGAEANLSSYWSTPVTVFNGVNSSQVYYRRDASPVGSFDTGIAGTNDCNEMITKINEKAEALAEEIGVSIEADRQAAKDQCKSAARAKYQEATNARDHAPNQTVKDRAQAVLDAIDAMGDVYWDEGPDGSITCKAIPTLGGGTETPDSGYIPPAQDGGGPSEVTGGGSDSDFAECLNGAGSLGWILCPVLNIVRVTVEGFYSDIEENWLPIEHNLLHTSGSDSDTAIYEAWKVFRNLANILFTIVLAVILLSQFTGFGISNYGIKKMLPSLIIMAVLVNISFFICQILVDVTNIVGAEIGGILENIGSTASGGTDITGGTVIKGAISVVFSAAGVGAALVGGVTAVVANPGLLIPVLIFGLGLIISLFFFFAILAVRKAGVYVTIILAPLAIACYALPNTKSWFDKWKKLFTALLFVYPICQALTGAGKMISSIMLSQGKNNFMLSVVAVIISFAPIFMIPSLIRGSLALMGNIGTKLSQFGNRMRGTATGALNNSDMIKRARISGANLGATKGRGLLDRANSRLRNARGIGRAVRKVEDSKLGQLIGKQNARRDAQAKMAYRKMLMDDASAANIAEHMNEESIQNDLAAQGYKYRQDLIGNTIDGMMNGTGSYTDAHGTTQAINTNDLDSLDSALDYYLSQYDSTGDDSALLNAQALMRLLIEGNGDKGRTAVMNRLKSRNFDAATGVGTRTASFDALSQYINRDSKWMAGLKTADTGSFRMIGDGAKGGALGNLHSYNTMGADKITNASVQSLGDSFFDGIQSAQTAGKYTVGGANYDAAAADDLLRMRDTFARAMADPMTAKDIKPDMLKEMNKINNQAYEIEAARWLDANPGKTRTDYEAQFGAYADLAPGHQLKIEHKKAAMPAEWRRATSGDAITNPGMGLKEGDWIRQDASGRATGRLSVSDANRADAIERQNIDADIQNSL